MPITEVEKIWKDGELVDWADANVHVLSHAVHYGSGVFEGIRAYETARGPAVWHLDEHLKRLFRSAKLYHMEIPYSIEAITDATKDVIRANGLNACYIRPLVLRGYGEMGVNPLNAPVNVFIAVWPWGAYLGEDALETGRADQDLVVAAELPERAAVLGEGLGPVHQRRARQDREPQGRVRRGHHAERAGIHHRRFGGERVHRARTAGSPRRRSPPGAWTASRAGPCIALARDLGYEVTEENLVRTDLYNADECFFTGTAAEITPIREVDDRAVGEGHRGPITKELQGAFFAATKGETDRYASWLTYVND